MHSYVMKLTNKLWR